SRFDLQPKWSKIINLWYEELQIAPNSVVHNFNLHGLNIGHFTQMAWASSRKIGCGFAAFRIVDPKFKVAHLYTCNYAPSGNRKGNSMYLEGAAMSRCPQSTQPSKKYSALCSYSDLEKKIKMNKIYVQPNNKTKTFQEINRKPRKNKKFNRLQNSEMPLKKCKYFVIKKQGTKRISTQLVPKQGTKRISTQLMPKQYYLTKRNCTYFFRRT
ncbi:vespid v5 venom allergen-like protein, partial [Dinothrombium tinctorium]